MTMKHVLYQSLRSPFARRIRVLLEELGVPYEVQTMDVFNLPPGYYEVNPLGRVPALKLADTQELLIDSNQIISFLRERYSVHPLFSRGAMSAAKVSRVTALGVGIMELTVQAFLESLRPVGQRSAIIREEFTSDIHRTLKILEGEFQGPYFFGEKMGASDIDLGVAMGYCELRLGADSLERYPRLKQYFRMLNCRPAFQKSVPPA